MAPSPSMLPGISHITMHTGCIDHHTIRYLYEKSNCHEHYCQIRLPLAFISPRPARRTISVLFLTAGRDTFHFTICNYNSQSNTMVYAVTRTRVTRETGTSRVVRLLKRGKGEQYVRIIKNGYRSGCVGRRCHSSTWSGD